MRVRSGVLESSRRGAGTSVYSVLFTAVADAAVWGWLTLC